MGARDRSISNFGAFGTTPVNRGDGQICCAAFSDWLSTTYLAIVDMFLDDGCGHSLVVIVDTFAMC